MRHFPLSLLLLAPFLSTCGSSPPPPPSPLTNLRSPHDHIDNYVRSPQTVLLISFFSNKRTTILQHCILNRDGTGGQIRFTPFAVQGGATLGHGTPMPPSQRATLDAALTSLPPSQSFTKDADAFLISYEFAGTWHTRTYNHSKLPPEVLALCNLAHIPPTWL